MKLINKKLLIKNVAKRWKSQYFYNGAWDKNTNCNPKITYGKLLLLPKNATEKQIEEIIGNDTWFGIYCHECNKNGVDVGIIFNSASGVAICGDCLKEAMVLIGSDKP